MKTQTSNAISYCFDLLSFIFQNKDFSDRIKRIYFFGSAVRGELNEDSDIDIFFDCEKKHELKIKKCVDSGIIKFMQSQDYAKWKLLKFTYHFSAHLGDLNEWDLKLSISSEGYLLYSKKAVIDIGNREAIFKIKYPEIKREYIKIKRLLFGRNEEYYKDGGLIQSLNGSKLCSNVFMVPKEEQTRMIDFLAKQKIDFSMKEIIVVE